MDSIMVDATHVPESPTQMSPSLPSRQEIQSTQNLIEQLEYELKQIRISIAREQRRQTTRLKEEHENWAPIIQDAKARLAEGAPVSATEELKALEEEENQGRTAIRQEFKQRTASLMEKQSAVEAELAKQKSFLASVRKVDEDALLEIFDHFVYTGGSPWVLAHTCSRWRSVVLSSKQLWSGILITTNIDSEVERRLEGKEVCNSLPRLERAIQRVGDAPIDLAISLNWSHAALDVQSTLAMITRITETCNHWRTLHIENSEKVLDGDYVFPAGTFDQGLPNVTQVSFHMQHHVHGNSSKGLLPFRELIDAIERTAEKLHAAHFHGFGHNELTDAYFSSPTRIEDLSLIHVEPRYIRRGYRALLDACPTSRAGWRYASFAGVAEFRLDSAREASFGFIVPSRRITLHGDIHEALRETVLSDIRILDIVTTSPLKLPHQLHLPRVYQLSVYSEELEDLRFIHAPNLDNFRIGLSSKELHHIHASMLALEGLWNRGTAPRPVRVSFEGIGVSGAMLRKLSTNNGRLEHVRLVDVTFERRGALLGLTEAAWLKSVEIVFTDQLDVGRVDNLSTDIRTLMLTRKESDVKLKRITLTHGTEEEVFTPDTI